MLSTLFLDRRNVCHALEKSIGGARARTLCHEWLDKREGVTDVLRSSTGLYLLALMFAGLAFLPGVGAGAPLAISALIASAATLHLGIAVFSNGEFQRIEQEMGAEVIEMAHMHARHSRDCGVTVRRPEACVLL